MKKAFAITMLISLVTMNPVAHAEEAAVEDVTAAEDVTADEVAISEEPQENWVECGPSYLNYVRGLAKPKQKAELENWWMISDSDYQSIRNDEFQYAEEKTKKEKEFAAALAQPAGRQSILAKVKFGTYDMKKKGFPLDIRLENGTLEDHFSGGMGFGGGLGGPPSAYVTGCAMRVDYKKKDSIPNTIKIKPTNSAKLKFLAVPEEFARQITTDLGSSRVKTVLLRFDPKQTQLVKKSLGTIKLSELVVSAEIKEIEVQQNDEKKVFTF
ncbi:hypothetical protein [Pseudobdellovibrio exovorus]|uniref:Uncharacterized protein n=1 Tax=Pseudobdellovibrio exovorus JSS TaxID=1184267 RepID=M4V9B3_9BACT|nr:hypothetical protein [Pseudobdellovibrio exovorus]AGH94616.1 hypothetical protein A11Q_396 [Pseudobdellovibrio exovorus JSS]